MEEHGGEGLSSIKEEGNRVHAAGTPAITQIEAGKHKVDLTSFKDSIFRIPGLFKMRNEQAYTPYKFSIGPWHFRKTQLLCTGQKLKESFLEQLIKRFPKPEEKESELKKAIKKVRCQARECYEGDVAHNGFEEILLLDGCFIIQFFCKVVELRENPGQLCGQENQFCQLLGGMIHVIIHDLLLLDNQIPWFVLELLFNETRELLFDETSAHLQCMNFTLVQVVMKFFGHHVSCYVPEQLTECPPWYDPSIIHLVDFVWRFWDGSSERREKVFDFLDYGTLIPSATRLKEAGVKFQKAESTNVLDVKFNKDKGVLEIPPLLITPSTETIFRNLIIFEQCRLLMPRVTSYAILLDCLVDTSDDVHLMNRAEILDNRLNPEETANFLNRVRDNTFTPELFYAQLRKDVNDYRTRGWPRWRASLIQNYFTKPWAIVSVVFATIVLFFTIMQVFYK